MEGRILPQAILYHRTCFDHDNCLEINSLDNITTYLEEKGYPGTEESDSHNADPLQMLLEEMVPIAALKMLQKKGPRNQQMLLEDSPDYPDYLQIVPEQEAGYPRTKPEEGPGEIIMLPEDYPSRVARNKEQRSELMRDPVRCDI